MSSSGTERGGQAGPRPRIVLVYNAEGGLLHGALDLLHKTLSPATYPCRLCAVSYGPLGMKARWRAFLAGLGCEIVFLHRDEYDGPHPLPAIFAEDGTVLVSARDFETIDSLEALESALLAALPER